MANLPTVSHLRFEGMHQKGLALIACQLQIRVRRNHLKKNQDHVQLHAKKLILDRTLLALVHHPRENSMALLSLPG